jgi:hypothetical protein
MDWGVTYPAEAQSTRDKAEWILKHTAEAWYDWRCDRVADVVSSLRLITRRRLGPDTVLGLFGIPLRESDHDGAIRRVFGQDWERLSPHVDVFSPMVYHVYCGRSLEWIRQVTTEVARRSGRAVWPMVQSFSIPTGVSGEEFEKALRAGAQTPSGGVMIYATQYIIEENKWDVMSRVYNELKPPVPAAGK